MSEGPEVAVPRRSGDEIHPWPPNGDLRPTAADRSYWLRTSAPERNPVLPSGRREAVDKLLYELLRQPRLAQHGVLHHRINTLAFHTDALTLLPPRQLVSML